jgi:hypothetical protein
MAVKLHRCSGTPIKGPHPCWQVQKALDEAGVDYEGVKHPMLRGRRREFIARSGQKLLPAIELDDGTIVREESKQLAARVREGRLTAGPTA